VAADPDPDDRRTYLCFEGARSCGRWSTRTRRRRGRGRRGEARERGQAGRRAIRTDFILSAEIMVISLNEVADEGLLARTLILVVVRS
jgi:predicted DNA repair protein MutK